MATLRRPRNVDGESGAILMWMALMMVVLLAIAAFAVDLGMAYAVKRQLSSTADAAALAGAQEGAIKFESQGGCTGGVPSTGLQNAIALAVQQTHDANAPWGSIGAPTPEITCTDDEVTVKVDERSDLGTFFARILGVTTLSPAATATANVFGSKIGGGLRPFTICVDDLRAADAEADAGVPIATRDTAYVNHNSSNPSFSDLGSGSWATTGVITMASSHGLHAGDWVEVVDNVDGASSGFYYVKSASGSTLTVSDTIDYDGPGDQTTVATPVTALDLYKLNEGLVGDGDSNWAKSDGAITEPGHGLDPGDTVRVVVTSGATPAVSALYDVEDVAGNTFTLLDGAGVSVAITSNGRADVYEWNPDASGPSTSACSDVATGAAGNWGYARFDLNGDQSTLRCLVEHGYGNSSDCDYGSPTGILLGDDDPTTAEVNSDGNTGNSISANNGWYTLLDSLVDEVILFPVAEVWKETGNNTQYTAKGGAGIQFCGYMFPKNNNAATPPTKLNDTGECWDDTLYATALANWADDTSLYVQWRYVDEFVTSYIGQSDASSDRCPLGDPECIPVLRLIE